MPTVDDLITDISQGQLRLPEFQRGYVWTRDQAREFLISLYRGHPTGHLLIWHAYGPVKARGGSGEAKGTTLLLLDGQQRLTTLYALIKGSPPPFYDEEKLFFDFYFSVIREEFHYYQKTLMDDNPEWISVHEFLKKGLNQFLDDLPLMPEEQRTLYQKSLGRLNQLDKIHSYKYEVDDLKDERLTLDEVVAIFNKVNSAGTRLSRADLAMAHICTFWPEARTEVHTFLARMRAHGFGIDPGFLVRATSAVAGGSVNYDQSFYNLSGVKFQAAWPQVRASFEYLINVLRHDAYIDSLDDLTSPLVLVPMLIHLARNGATFKDARERDAFLRWMYLANIWGRYTGQTDTKLRRDFAALSDGEPVTRLVEAIAADRGRIVLEARDLEGRGPTSGVYKFALVLARSRGAKDWFTGQTLYQKAIGKSNGLHSHHIFPRAVLRSVGITERAVVNQIANRAFLTQKANLKIAAQEPVKYLPIVERDFPKALQQQSVPMDENLWAKSNYLAFVGQRRRMLARSMNAFLAKFGADGDGAGATVGVESLLGSQESQVLEFKSSLRWDYTLNRTNRDLEQAVVKAVAGMLNADGGNLLLGVDDEGQVLGVSPDYESSQSIGGRDGFERHLRAVLRAAVGDATMAFVGVTFHEIDGVDICQVRVESSDHPIHVPKDGAQVFFVRQGNATRAMDSKESLAYVTSHWPDH